MLWVVSIARSTCIVKKGEQFDNTEAGAIGAANADAVIAYACPMGHSMHTLPIQAELTPQQRHQISANHVFAPCHGDYENPGTSASPIQPTERASGASIRHSFDQSELLGAMEAGRLHAHEIEPRSHRLPGGVAAVPNHLVHARLEHLID